MKYIACEKAGELILLLPIT